MTQMVDAGPFRIACEDAIEAARATTYATKEPGTLAWLAEIASGEVVYDVGANIGLYTLTAAAAVGSAGHVYAFEPHVANAASLLRNLRVNGLADRVSVLTFALGAEPGLVPFYYASKRAGSSGSQLGAPIGEHGAAFTPAAVELKWVWPLDALVAAGLRPPTRIKIDVDGQEPGVLAGAARTLAQHAQTVQIERHPLTVTLVETAMRAAGYAFIQRHNTASGAASIAAGVDHEAVAHNAIYTRPVCL